LGLPQSHISDIEKGKKDIRLSTLIEIARVLGLELVLIPRELVPAVTSLCRPSSSPGREERPAYDLETMDIDNE
jgi:transcriptional regulator with XRE-family HTH domain